VVLDEEGPAVVRHGGGHRPARQVQVRRPQRVQPVLVGEQPELRAQVRVYDQQLAGAGGIVPAEDKDNGTE
jgi:hypothetical protein